MELGRVWTSQMHLSCVGCRLSTSRFNWCGVMERDPLCDLSIDRGP